MKMQSRVLAVLVLMTMVGSVASGALTQTPAPAGSARDQVFAAERAFAKTMQDRDLAAFTRHLSKDAIFFGQGIDRGPAAVTAAWKVFFDAPTPPFSWEPASVEVVESGTLAFSSGPVRGPDGRETATFNSVWRLEDDGAWRVVFDKGCRCPPPAVRAHEEAARQR